MAPLYVALVRHGHYHQAPGVPSAHLPHGLTGKGRQQASALTPVLDAFVAKYQVALHSTIYCSTLRRAYETALLAAQASSTALNIEQDSRLCERSLGSAANLDVATIEAIVAEDPRGFVLPANWKSSREVALPLPGAESLGQAGARVAAYIQQTCAAISHRQTEPELVVFIGHGASMRHAAVELGVLRVDQAVTWSMHHATPVFLQRHDWQRWEHIEGNWKERVAATQIND